MRRKDKEITSRDEIVEIISRCKVCRLAVSDQEQPYIVPLNFGYLYENGELTLYFHGARAGRKMEILARNPKVCFELDTAHQLLEAEEACKYSYAFESVVGFGEVRVLEDAQQKAAGLNRIMRHQTGENRDFDFPAAALSATAVYMVRADELTGKRKLAAPQNDA